MWVFVIEIQGEVFKKQMLKKPPNNKMPNCFTEMKKRQHVFLQNKARNNVRRGIKT